MKIPFTYIATFISLIYGLAIAHGLVIQEAFHSRRKEWERIYNLNLNKKASENIKFTEANIDRDQQNSNPRPPTWQNGDFLLQQIGIDYAY